jgi:hypothetical protein
MVVDPSSEFFAAMRGTAEPVAAATRERK